MHIRHRFLALSLTCALGFLGCSSGDQNSSPAGGGPPIDQSGNQFLSFSLDLGPFGGTNRADVLMVNTPEPGTDNPVAVAFTNNQNNFAVPNVQPDIIVGRDRSPDREAADLAAFQAGVQNKALPSDSEIQARFEQIAQGDTFDFNTGADVVTAQKMLSEAQTVHCVVFAEVVEGVPVIDEARALAFAQAWDTDNPFRPGSGIYDQVRAAFGSEWNVNPTGGRDGDLKVVLLFLSRESAGGDGTFGFFRPVDELTRAQAPSSNEGEILYINAEELDFDVLATLAHEFQHMVRFNMKFIQQGTFAGQFEDRTLNEGASVNAEEICGYSLDAPGGGNSFIFSTARTYLNQAADTNLFFGFDNGGQFYGGGYLLVKYFREQFGEGAFVQFNTNTGVGYDNMVAVSGLTREGLWRRFSLAMLASGFTGNVPPEARFPSGFATNGTFDVRGVGASTLPGLKPKRVSSNAESQAIVSIRPYSVTDLRLNNGSGGELILAGQVGGQSLLEVVLQSAPTVVSDVVLQGFGDVQP